MGFKGNWVELQMDSLPSLSAGIEQFTKHGLRTTGGIYHTPPLSLGVIYWFQHIDLELLFVSKLSVSCIDQSIDIRGGHIPEVKEREVQFVIVGPFDPFLLTRSSLFLSNRLPKTAAKLFIRNYREKKGHQTRFLG